MAYCKNFYSHREQYRRKIARRQRVIQKLSKTVGMILLALVTESLIFAFLIL